jgi:Chaperone of endosialidase
VDNSCFIGNIFGVTTVGVGTAVLVDSAGQLGTISSSRRFKHEIKPMAEASAAILALKPVTFHYKSDTKDMPQFGLIAEDVADVNPDLVVRDENGEIYSVRYDQVNAMLLNEFLKEHKRVEELNAKLAEQSTVITRQRQEFQTTVARQDKEIRALIATAKEQAAQIQKVSAQIEVNKAPLQLSAAKSP